MTEVLKPNQLIITSSAIGSTNPRLAIKMSGIPMRMQIMFKDDLARGRPHLI